MGLSSFIKQNGEKFFVIGNGRAAQRAIPSAEQAAALERTTGNAIETLIGSTHLEVDTLNVRCDATSRAVTTSGVTPEQATREKLTLYRRNVAQASEFNGLMTVATSKPELKLGTTATADSCSKLSRQGYDTAAKYPQIFRTSKSMLPHPDKIYPGQLPHIPA